MNEIYLIEAVPEYAEQVWIFRQEILDCDKSSGSQFAGCLSLDESTSSEEWIRWCQLRTSKETCGQTGVDVPSTTFFEMRKSDDRLVGIIDLRHHINHPLLSTWGGHCGYTVRPSEQGHGYAKEMLCLNLSNAKNLV
ncbi:GNAT family N-acetyltransferase [Ruminococcus sp.]|uniref:GNAT family N-acetyltransferase n=1 Tax=Ruminococcus sp. TaxID=41978 RepID=UPI00388DA765